MISATLVLVVHAAVAVALQQAARSGTSGTEYAAFALAPGITLGSAIVTVILLLTALGQLKPTRTDRRVRIMAACLGYAALILALAV